jgi:hypothetical protein
MQFSTIEPCSDSAWLVGKPDILVLGPTCTASASIMHVHYWVYFWKGADRQLRFEVENFLLRSRRGSAVGSALHFLFCVCWVFQGRIT